MRRRLLALLLTCFASASLAFPATAAERITSYDSLIEVAPDGTLTVTETIAVEAAGKKIKRGIYRDFPTTYEGRWGTRVVVPFQVLGVERDGAPESYHTQKIDDGVRVYMGRKNRQIEHGPHTYSLKYKTRRQIGFFEEHDELYWNVTGNFWEFPIEKATARVRLPGSVDPANIAQLGFTGPVGSRNRDLRHSVDIASGEARFETSRPLPIHHGLTIVTMFPKGHVQPPSDDELKRALYDANKALFVAGAGALCVLAYYLAAWMLVGRDPEAGTIIPRFEPPRGISPACMRFLMRMGYDTRCFATALVSMAVKDYLRIDDSGGKYTLVRVGDDKSGLSTGEKRIANKLLDTQTFKLRQSRHKQIRSAIATFKDWLNFENDSDLFRANKGWFVPGVLISIGAVVAAGASGSVEQSAPAAFILLWLSLWTLGVVAMLREVIRRWRDAFRARSGLEKIGSWIGALFLTAFAAPFVGGEVMGLFFLTKMTSILMVPVLLTLIGSNVVFYTLLKRPTLAGRRLMDEIEGFKMYLRTAEGDEIRRLEAPKPTPELFERYLPYALALGVENEWSERFADVLERAAADPDSGYSPVWYRGQDFRSLGTEGLVSSIGSSLSSAVSSTSTAPGSSSGGGGGGSSGGGGGGGGGGGW
jgi:uncharacterized membrane protein YgcG